jgi:hypothetical protein
MARGIAAHALQRKPLQVSLRAGDEVDVGAHGLLVALLVREGADQAGEVEHAGVAEASEALADDGVGALLTLRLGQFTGDDPAAGVADLGVEDVAEAIPFRGVAGGRHGLGCAEHTVVSHVIRRPAIRRGGYATRTLCRRA